VWWSPRSLVCVTTDYYPLIVNFCVAFILQRAGRSCWNVFKDPDAFVSDAAFLFLLASLIVFIFGPGALSIDALFRKLLGRSPTPSRKRVSPLHLVQATFRAVSAVRRE
jgi:hypothetical protein